MEFFAMQYTIRHRFDWPLKHSTPFISPTVCLPEWNNEKLLYFEFIAANFIINNDFIQFIAISPLRFMIAYRIERVRNLHIQLMLILY